MVLFLALRGFSLGILVRSSPQKLTCPNSNSTRNKVTLRAEATFSLCELVTVQKVASADNRSIFYRACTKFVTGFASKINCQVSHQMARVSQE